MFEKLLICIFGLSGIGKFFLFCVIVGLDKLFVGKIMFFDKLIIEL